MFGNWKKSIH
jgi:hypothetical protein